MQKKKIKKICVFSGKRGGFGAYVLVMRQIKQDPDLELQILLADMHTSKEFGNTVKEAKHLFPKTIIKLIAMGTGRGDSPLMRVENLGVCLTKTAKILTHLKPDIIIVHGDRGEHLVVAFAALNLGIVVAHSQGGELSGNIDDIQRHAITKLAHIHFPETHEAAKRIIKLGEDPKRVHIVGSTYIDRIVKKMYTPFSTIQKKYGLKKNERYTVVLCHPDTFETRESNYCMMKNILSAVEHTTMRAFVIYPCSDPGYERIIKAINEKKNSKQFMIYKNIDNLDFLSLLSKSIVLIGNSSSAFVEAPYFQLPALNIGQRQIGRNREANVLNVKSTVKDLDSKIKYVMYNQNFKKVLSRCGTKLCEDSPSEKIFKILKNLVINKSLLKKRIMY